MMKVNAIRRILLITVLVNAGSFSGVARPRSQEGAAANTSTSSAPAASSAAGAFVSTLAEGHGNYRIGAGDVIEIRVLGEEQMSSKATRVSEDGLVQVPFIEESVRAGCLTERELGTAIAERLRKYLKYPEVHVAVVEFNSMPVAIMGSVNAPGQFKMQRRVRLLDLLAYAGGPKTEAGKLMYVVHSGPEEPCDISGPTDVARPTSGASTEAISLSLLMQGDASQDRLVRPGDIVIVPKADLVFVAGEVLKPDAYPLRDGMTLSQALALAGGPSPVASTNSIRIVRQEPGKPRQEIPVDLKAIQANKVPDPLLQANDVVEVPSSKGKTFFRNFMGAIGGSAAQLPVRVVP